MQQISQWLIAQMRKEKPNFEWIETKIGKNHYIWKCSQLNVWADVYTD